MAKNPKRTDRLSLDLLVSFCCDDDSVSLQPIDVNDPKYFFSASGTKRMLRVHECGQKDEGIYSCRVQEKSTQAKLYVSREWILRIFLPQGLDAVALCMCLLLKPNEIYSHRDRSVQNSQNPVE